MPDAPSSKLKEEIIKKIISHKNKEVNKKSNGDKYEKLSTATARKLV